MVFRIDCHITCESDTSELPFWHGHVIIFFWQRVIALLRKNTCYTTRARYIFYIYIIIYMYYSCIYVENSKNRATRVTRFEEIVWKIRKKISSKKLYHIFMKPCPSRFSPFLRAAWFFNGFTSDILDILL